MKTVALSGQLFALSLLTSICQQKADELVILRNSYEDICLGPVTKAVIPIEKSKKIIDNKIYATKS